MSRLFGTDGVRGIAGSELSAELAMRIGIGIGKVLSENCKSRIKAVIGADTRCSSEMLVCALKAGLLSGGADVIDIAIAPTPAVAYLVMKNGADAGIVVSASHNPYEYNGIKVFGRDGQKIPDEIEHKIEGLVSELTTSSSKQTQSSFGKILTPEYGIKNYMEHLGGICSDLSGIKAVIDCANGACTVTKSVFEERLGDCRFIGTEPNGKNINDRCGSTSLDRLKSEVLATCADIGIAFDGDGDRCLAVDENGKEIDGDYIMAIIAKRLKMNGLLYKNSVVGTIMTNLGFLRFCETEGINYCSTKVGDRYVLEMMEQEGYILGGEQSGHIILRQHATTGDGQLTALTLLSILKESGLKLSELASVMKKYPQYSDSIKADENAKLILCIDKEIQEIIELYKKENPDTRLVVRASGTEPVIRIMAEGEDSRKTEAIVKELKAELTRILKKS